MKFDAIIIGGGLCGLTAGISLAREGKKCLIVSSGQSALHFFSGSLEFYGLNKNPFEAVAGLGESHPYSKIGLENLKTLAASVKPFFKDAGIVLKGDGNCNHWRFTPLGTLKPAWLTLDEYAVLPSDGSIPWKKVALLNVDGFMDFHTSYIAAGLDKMGVESVVRGISIPELERLRINPTEMRSTNLAKTLSGDLVATLAARINEHTMGVDAVLMPAIVGLDGYSDVVRLKEMVNRPLHFLATLPPSVPGIRVQMMLRRYFQKLGGVYMLGDSVNGGGFDGGRLRYITTVNHGNVKLEADDFILASGSFFSKGLVADVDGIREPIFGIDVDYAAERSQWYRKNMFEAQPYMSFGVVTDKSFHVVKDGTMVPNLYAAGSLLGGFNALKEGCGAGVAILTALHISKEILKK